MTAQGRKLEVIDFFNQCCLNATRGHERVAVHGVRASGSASAPSRASGAVRQVGGAGAMNRSLPFASIAGFLLLAGCADGAADLGRAVPTSLAAFHREVEAPLRGMNARARTEHLLRQAVDTIAQGDMQAIHAEISAPRQADGETLRRFLVEYGVDPSRITVVVGSNQRTPLVSVARVGVVSSDCSEAVEWTLGNDPMPSMMNAAHCRQDQDLARAVVDPADLVAPPTLGRGDGAYLAGGVRAMRTQIKDPDAVRGSTGDAGTAGAPKVGSAPGH
jgi:type IV pilus biogenesis protein CpaD/CtpE